MNKKNYYLLLALFCFSISFAQSHVIKLSSISTSNPYNDSFFEFERSSFATSYENAFSNRSSAEVMIVLARSISYDETLGYGKIVVPVQGLGIEAKWRYYFQTNPNFITYSPYGWYAAPTISYTSLKGTNEVVDKNDIQTDPATGLQFVNPKSVGTVTNNISYMAVGALAGYQFIMEEYEYGVIFDFGLGFNYIASSEFSRSSITNDPKSKDLDLNPLETQKLNTIIPKLHFSIGFAF